MDNSADPSRVIDIFSLRKTRCTFATVCTRLTTWSYEWTAGSPEVGGPARGAPLRCRGDVGTSAETLAKDGGNANAAAGANPRALSLRGRRGVSRVCAWWRRYAPGEKWLCRRVVISAARSPP